MKIGIIGCGNLGSNLAYSMIMRSNIENVESIWLVDNDILEGKNLPYLYMNNMIDDYEKFLTSPKVLCLQYLLKKLSPSSDIVRFYDDYKDVKFPEDMTLIDARDTSDENDLFTYKLNIDGKFGRVIVNPRKSSTEQKRNNYALGSYNYYSLLLSFMACEKIIFNHTVYKNHVEFIADLEEVKFYEQSSDIK